MADSLEKIHVATAALTGTIYIGRIDKKGQCFTSKRDATNEVLSAVIDYMMHDSPKGAGQVFSKDGGKTNYRITVAPCESPES